MVLLIGFDFFDSDLAAGHILQIHETELKPAPLAESVVKFESTKNVKGDFPLKEFTGALVRNTYNIIGVNRPSREPHGWRHFECADCFFVRRKEVRGQGGLADFNVCPIFTVIGWRLATVFEPKQELRRQRVATASF